MRPVLLALALACKTVEPLPEPPPLPIVCYRLCDTEMLAFRVLPNGSFECQCKTRDQVPLRSRATLAVQ